MSFPKILHGSLARVFAAGTLAALLSACVSSVKLPDEPRKFKVGQAVPEVFEFFRSDEEIRGRLLSGTWKSREVKWNFYSETISGWQSKPSRKNSPPIRETHTFTFFEDGNFTERVERSQSGGGKTEEVLSGRWIVKNGSLGLYARRLEFFEIAWEYYSLRFLDGKTVEIVEDDFVWAAKKSAADNRSLAAKHNFHYTKQNVKFFQDENGNRYCADNSESEMQVPGFGLIRTRTKSIQKRSPFILERQ